MGVELTREWQPIETAPKDGTVILLHYADHSLSGYPSNVRGKKEVAIGYYSQRKGWEVGVPGGYSYGGGDDQFTHWQPLPEPPHDL